MTLNALASSPADGPLLPGPVQNSLGFELARLRRQRTGPTGAVLSQEELAFCSGTDQAHVSRIENGRRNPEFFTLSRICDALSLTPMERTHLLELAGFNVQAPPPAAKDALAVRNAVGPQLEGLAYPAALIDDTERHWYLNSFAVRLWGHLHGSSDPQTCNLMSTGRRGVEFAFGRDSASEREDRWRVVYENADEVLDRLVRMFWRVSRVRPRDLEIKRTVDLLSVNPGFRARWERAQAASPIVEYLDHGVVLIKLPDMSPTLRLGAWRTRVSMDDRFLVVHFKPADDSSAARLGGFLLSSQIEGDNPRPSSCLTGIA